MLRRPPSQPNTATVTVTNPSTQMLDPGLTPRPSDPNSNSSVNLDFPPVTPLPQPSIKDGEEQYAAAEGQVISETEVTGKYKLYKDGDRWVAVWKGEVKIGMSVVHLCINMRLTSLRIRSNSNPGSSSWSYCFDHFERRSGQDGT
jgi:hypothetical protein